MSYKNENGNRYCMMFIDFLWSHLDQINIENLLFRQNTATYYASEITFSVLCENLPNRIILLHKD